MSPVRRGDVRPIHNRLAVLRAERKMTRAELAALIEVNPQTIGALERGDHYPSLDLAFRICEIFDLPVEAVFSREPFGPLSTELYRKDGRSIGGTRV
ncbi:helix-turn-helix transcriptional regulator [Mycobacterium kyogaense]|uniref:helix-turn-helix transcriptional regulator n=1 Tax=Mycobacterium kyogaense TaxID=2212479 RepID=UPI000DAECE83|nr:helix-turn-helix transcriptional regulator [Mycobacterium kyogaense]